MKTRRPNTRVSLDQILTFMRQRVEGKSSKYISDYSINVKNQLKKLVSCGLVQNIDREYFVTEQGLEYLKVLSCSRKSDRHKIRLQYLEDWDD
jgi:predicted transcriptional regulator